MKFSHFILSFLLSGILAGLSCACSDEQPFVDDASGVVKPSDKPGRYSVKVKIMAAGGEMNSRADYADGELVDGSHENDHAIGNNGHVILFFDEDQNLTRVQNLVLGSESHPEEDEIEAEYKSSIQPDNEGNFPKYCMVLLNCEPLYDKLLLMEGNVTADDILKEIWTDSDLTKIGKNEDGLFTMTNSTYFDGSGKLQTLVEVKPEMIIDNENPADKAEKLVIYVERMLAKFTLEVAPSDRMQKQASGEYLYSPDGKQLVIFDDFDEVSGAPKFISRSWKVAFTGWNMNALEKQIRLFKYINPTTNYFSNWNWKSPSEYRTYWSEDDHYAGDYPWQYRRSVYPAVNYYEDFKERNVNQLRNFSYNQLELDDLKYGKTVYTPENTYNYSAIEGKLDGRADLLAGTHIILGARLRVDDGKGNYVNEDLYRDREGFYYRSEKACFKSLVYSFNSALTSQDIMKFTFYNWSGKSTTANGTILYAKSEGEYALFSNGTQITNKVIDGFANNFLAEGCIRGGDGKRMPWLGSGTLSIKRIDNNTLADIYICDADGNVLRKASEDEIKSLLFEWVGAFDHFNEGRMYYCAPAVIQKAASKADKDICGVVRNSWYYYNLGDINSIGTPVDDPDQEIIPNPTQNNDQLNLTVRILGWHTVDIYLPIL